jgi:RNA polymerase sigma factor (sigma-70 family)
VKLPPFQDLLDSDGPAVHGYLVALLGPDDGADCFQDTMVAALGSYPGLRDASNLRSWLFTIAHHRAVDRFRSEGRSVTVADLPERVAAPVDADPELWKAVAKLPPKQRAAVVMRYLADMPYADIGEIVGCSEAAARQNVRAALANLREVLDR